MKRLCFATIFNILLCRTKIKAKKLYQNICSSINLQYHWNDGDDVISRSKNGQRSLQADLSENLQSKDFELFKEDFTFLVIPLLPATHRKNILLNIKDVLFSDETIPNDIPLVPSYERSRKDTLLFSQDLSEVLSVVFYYSIISVDNRIYNNAKTDKITDLLSDDKLLELHPEWLERKKQDPNDHGIVDTYIDVDEIDYKKLIEGAKEIDIVHIYGKSWTNNQRGSLAKSLKKPETVIRAVFLSPISIFSAPYANFIKTEHAGMVSSLKETILYWQGIYGTNPVGKLILHIADFFPSKSLYRFDKSIIVNPSRMVRSREPDLPTLLCRDIETGKPSFFSIYSNEINAIIKLPSTVCFDMSETPFEEVLDYINSL